MKTFALLTILIWTVPLIGLTHDSLDVGIDNIYHDLPSTVKAVSIDGSLDEEAWEQALVLELNYEVEPGENIDPPVRTTVYLIHDSKHLYVGFIAYDPDPSQIRARISARDNNWADDWVGIILDTYNDERRTYDFICNPLGVQTDQIESNYGAGGDSWDAIWNSAGRITDSGYVVEMAIPFRALNFHRSDSSQVWGIDAIRSYPRNVRHHIGLFPRDRNLNCYMSQSDKIIGFAGVTPGSNIEIDPTFSTLLTQVREDGTFENTSERYDPGVTAHWGFTPNMKLSLAVNPDFSQIEADAAALDVNRQYAIYYPEKRPFFLEGADFFGYNVPVMRGRSFADPEWGVRITGKEGDNSIGFNMVQDSITNILIPYCFYSQATTIEKKNLGTVLRYRRDLGITSNVGFIVTDREGDDYYNRMGGADFTFNITQYDRLTMSSGYSRTKYPQEISSNFNQPDTVFDGWTILGGYYHNSRNQDWFVNFWIMDPYFRGDLGFVYQCDYKNICCGYNRTWFNSPDNWYNYFNLGCQYAHEQNFQDTLVYQELSGYFQLGGIRQSWLEGHINWGSRTYQGIEFDQRYASMFAGFRPFGWVYLSIWSRYGDQIDYSNVQLGKRFNFNPYIEFNIGRNIYVEIDHDYEYVNVDQGRLYNANITNLCAMYHFSHRSYIRAIVQHVYYQFNQDLYPYPVDSELSQIFTQLLYSYQINPQTVLFLGYSDNYRGDEYQPITQTDRTFFAKVGYAFVI